MTDASCIIPPETLLECAIETARIAGTHALNNFSRRSEVVRMSHHDVKLQLDIECQQKAESFIKTRFLSHAFLGEETAKDNNITNQEYQWIVDPIDGTVNFSHGLPLWCCSVAVRLKEEVIAGAVFAPMLNELFCARTDGPALCNDKPVRVSTAASLQESIVLTGTDRQFEGNPAPLSILKSIASRVQRTRVLGSAAMDLCHVAAGRADGYFEGEIYIWDISAGGLIVRRAGGTTESIRPPNQSWKMAYLATNGRIHEELKAAIGF
jgi:myo-inositol-1(or 4)-monophosphatase